MQMSLFKANSRNKLPSKNQGFSLMEVLISMIVIAIGLLGYMALQLASINSNQEGLARSQATLIAQDLSSLMRADRDLINTPGAGNEYLDADFSKVCADGNAPTTQPAFNIWTVCMSMKGFTSADAGDDLLPEGDIFITCSDIDGSDADTCSPGSLQYISVIWRESAAREDVGQEKVAMNTRCETAARANSMSDEVINASQCVLLDLIP